MRVTRFNPRAALIVVQGHVWGVHGERAGIRLALDTGAGETLIMPDVLDRIGYSPRQGETRTVIRSAVASEPGYLLHVRRLCALGHDLADFRVHAHDLPEGFGIDGLLGLSFLRGTWRTEPSISAAGDSSRSGRRSSAARPPA